MNQIGRKIYYDTATGNVILDTGERQGSVVATTTEQDISSYAVLKERVRETFDIIELTYGDYAQDFSECDGYRVNLTTKTLEFSYPDPSVPTAEPVYQKALTEQNAELQQTIAQMSADFQGLTDLLTELGVI